MSHAALPSEPGPTLPSRRPLTKTLRDIDRVVLTEVDGVIRVNVAPPDSRSTRPAHRAAPPATPVRERVALAERATDLATLVGIALLIACIAWHFG
jgi:hypothetical protein